MLSDRVTLGGRLTFVGGKGGVGKTTVAAALAVELADAGETLTIISVDPAHSLGDAFQTALSPDPAPLPQLPAISAAEIDAALERSRFMERRGAHLRQLIERGTYLDSTDVEQISAGSVPGLDEIAALLSLQRIAASSAGRLIIDTAPTGHALRLLELPELALRWIGALEAMDEKHIAVASAIAGFYRADSVSDFLAELRQEISRLGRLLRDPGATRFLLVTTSEPIVLAETYRLQDRLEEMGIAPAGIVINRSSARDGGGEGVVSLPLLPHSPRGVDGLRELTRVESARDGADHSSADSAPGLSAGAAFQLPMDRELYFVVGKGGVGKSTTAAAIASVLAEATPGRILLLSVDPAGSLGDVLEAAVGPEPVEVEGVARLQARQLDASASWADFRERYRRDVEHVLGRSSGSSAGLDKAVLDRLLDLSPAGLDELVALLEVIDVNEDRVYDAVVVDTAPTGHLLRLLEMPQMALEWTHSLLRLLLKYRDVVNLSGTGERVLALAKSLRRVQALLRDPAATCFVVVTLPDALSVAETLRLLPKLEELGSGAEALVINRAFDGAGRVYPEVLARVQEIAADRPQLTLAGAPLQQPGPRGVTQLRDFINAWRLIEQKPVNTQ